MRRLIIPFLMGFLLLLVIAPGNAPNYQKNVILQSDMNAGGFSITNTANVGAQQFTLGGISISTWPTGGGGNITTLTNASILFPTNNTIGASNITFLSWLLNAQGSFTVDTNGNLVAYTVTVNNGLNITGSAAVNFSGGESISTDNGNDVSIVVGSPGYLSVDAIVPFDGQGSWDAQNATLSGELAYPAGSTISEENNDLTLLSEGAIFNFRGSGNTPGYIEAGGIVLTNGLTNLSATASTLAKFDANQGLVSIPNGVGALNDDGNGNFSWVPGGGGSSDAPLPDGATIISNLNLGTWSVVPSAITNGVNAALLAAINGTNTALLGDIVTTSNALWLILGNTNTALLATLATASNNLWAIVGGTNTAILTAIAATSNRFVANGTTITNWVTANFQPAGTYVTGATSDNTLFPSSIPITGTSLTFTPQNQNANTIYAGPASGGSGEPSFQSAPTFSGLNLTSLTQNSGMISTSNSIFGFLLNTNTALLGDLTVLSNNVMAALGLTNIALIADITAATNSIAGNSITGTITAVFGGFATLTNASIWNPTNNVVESSNMLFLSSLTNGQGTFGVDTNGNLTAYTLSLTTSGNTPEQAIGSLNGFYQLFIQNTSGGNQASVDVVVANNLNSGAQGTAFYGDFGMNGSNYGNNGFTGFGGRSNDVYLIAIGTPTGTASTSNIDLILGVNQTNQSVIISAGNDLSLSNALFNMNGLQLVIGDYAGLGTGLTNAGGDGYVDKTITNSLSTQVITAGTTESNVFATITALALQGQTITNVTQPTNINLTDIAANWVVNGTGQFTNTAWVPYTNTYLSLTIASNLLAWTDTNGTTFAQGDTGSTNGFKNGTNTIIDSAGIVQNGGTFSGNGINISNAQTGFFGGLSAVTTTTTSKYPFLSGLQTAYAAGITNASIFLPGAWVFQTLHVMTNTLGLTTGSNVTLTIMTNGHNTGAMAASGISTVIGPNPAVNSSVIYLTNEWVVLRQSMAGSGSFALSADWSLSNQ